MRNWPARRLLVVGLALLVVPSLLIVGFTTLALMDQGEFKAEIEKEWNPPKEKIQEELDTYRGSWMQQMTRRPLAALMFETFLFGIWSFWRAGGLMLIGMAFYRWRIITAEKGNGSKSRVRWLVSLSAIRFRSAYRQPEQPGF